MYHVHVRIHVVVRMYVKMDSSYRLVPAVSYTYIHTYVRMFIHSIPILTYVR